MLTHTETLNLININDIIYHLTGIIVPSLIKTLPSTKKIVMTTNREELLSAIRARQPTGLTLHINGKLNIRYSLLHKALGTSEYNLLVRYMADFESHTFENYNIISEGEDAFTVYFYLTQPPTGRGCIIRYSDLLCDSSQDLIGISNEHFQTSFPELLCEATELTHSLLRLKTKKAD